MQTCPLGYAIDQCLIQVLGDGFGGGIALVEGCGFVEVGVVEWRDHAIDLLLDGMKITQQFFLVELGATHCHENTPIVAVLGFPLALDHNGMGGRKSVFSCTYRCRLLYSRYNVIRYVT